MRNKSEWNKEQTLIIIKPDGVKKKLIGECLRDLKMLALVL
jgi:nucleoside diphosphate kinase